MIEIEDMGRGTYDFDGFQTSQAELEALVLIYYGLSYEEAAEIKNNAQITIETQIHSLKKRNGIHKATNTKSGTIDVLRLAYRRELLNPYALLGIASAKPAEVDRLVDIFDKITIQDHFKTANEEFAEGLIDLEDRVNTENYLAVIAAHFLPEVRQ